MVDCFFFLQTTIGCVMFSLCIDWNHESLIDPILMRCRKGKLRLQSIEISTVKFQWRNKERQKCTEKLFPVVEKWRTITTTIILTVHILWTLTVQIQKRCDLFDHRRSSAALQAEHFTIRDEYASWWSGVYVDAEMMRNLSAALFSCNYSMKVCFSFVYREKEKPTTDLFIGANTYIVYKLWSCKASLFRVRSSLLIDHVSKGVVSLGRNIHFSDQLRPNTVRTDPRSSWVRRSRNLREILTRSKGMVYFWILIQKDRPVIEFEYDAKNLSGPIGPLQWSILKIGTIYRSVDHAILPRTSGFRCHARAFFLHRSKSRLLHVCVFLIRMFVFTDRVWHLSTKKSTSRINQVNE